MNPSASTQTEFEDHGSVVIVVSIFLLITSTLVVLARLVTKWMVSKRYHVDDGLLVVSQVRRSTYLKDDEILTRSGVQRFTSRRVFDFGVERVVKTVSSSHTRKYYLVPEGPGPIQTLPYSSLESSVLTHFNFE